MILSVIFLFFMQIFSLASLRLGLPAVLQRCRRAREYFLVATSLRKWLLGPADAGLTWRLCRSRCVFRSLVDAEKVLKLKKYITTQAQSDKGTSLRPFDIAQGYGLAGRGTKCVVLSQSIMGMELKIFEILTLFPIRPRSPIKIGSYTERRCRSASRMRDCMRLPIILSKKSKFKELTINNKRVLEQKATK